MSDEQRRIVLDSQKWKNPPERPWPWRTSAKGNATTNCAGYLLVVVQSDRYSDEPRWHFVYKHTSDESFKSSPAVYTSEEQAKKAALAYARLGEIVSPDAPVAEPAAESNPERERKIIL